MSAPDVSERLIVGLDLPTRAQAEKVVLEWPESLAHIAELAKRRIRLVALRTAGRCLLGRTPAAAPKEENDKQSSDGNEDDESGYHTRTGRGRRDDCSAPMSGQADQTVTAPRLEGV